MKIGELAEKVGISVHTIRYYERIGLLPRADRTPSGHRDYDASILAWIGLVQNLKITGMPMRTMLRYASLIEGAAATQGERKQILEAHRRLVRDRVDQLQACLLVLDRKIAIYSQTEQRTKIDDEFTDKFKHSHAVSSPPGNR